MKKVTPTTKLTKSQAKALKNQKTVNRIEGRADANDGRDTRMARDGGTNRRLRK